MIFAVILFFIVMFFVFVVVFRKIMNQNITTAVQHLDDINQDYMKKQDEINKKLEEAENTYQQTLAKAKDEALKARQDILKQTQAEKEETLKEAKKEADDIIQQAEKTRHSLISELEKKIETESIKKSSKLLSQALPDQVRVSIHFHLVKELIDVGLKELDKLEVPKNLKEVKLVCALELDQREKNLIVGKIKEKVSKTVEVREESDPELVAGCMMVMGSLVFDGSLRFKISENARELIEKTNE
jgi:F0F1-type ATP synthase membrane subunit b/b'